MSLIDMLKSAADDASPEGQRVLAAVMNLDGAIETMQGRDPLLWTQERTRRIGRILAQYSTPDTPESPVRPPEPAIKPVTGPSLVSGLVSVPASPFSQPPSN